MLESGKEATMDKVTKCLTLALALAMVSTNAAARTKLVALPERAATIIRLDNPAHTLVEEERVLTLQKGPNQIDFSWTAVRIDPDSIRIRILSHPDKVRLISVSYPPGEAALTWNISSDGAWEENVRISYLLTGIDRLIEYKALTTKDESKLDLNSLLVLRNFSGEDFGAANVLLNYGEAFEKSIQHEETKRMLFLSTKSLPIRKVWTFDAAKLPWDPEKVPENVGIPVMYEIENKDTVGLGKFGLWGGKARIYQDDGHGSTIFLGEDRSGFVPVGEKMKLYIGDSRDIVVTQRKMREDRTNVRRNRNEQIVLFDTDEVINVKIENFKDKDAALTLIEHIPGQWEMVRCPQEYKLKDADTLEFEIPVKARDKVEFSMHYQRKNVRP
jgi:hypothetical protein